MGKKKKETEIYSLNINFVEMLDTYRNLKKNRLHKNIFI